MAQLLKDRARKAGLPPGTLVHIGDVAAEKTTISVISYDENQCFAKTANDPGEDLFRKDKPGVTWINVDGISETEAIERMGRIFDLHPLLLEDIMNSDQRPKMENYDDYLFMVLRTLAFDDKTQRIVTQQVSFVLGRGYVISFQERSSQLFDRVREHLTDDKWHIRKMGADYLLYTLIDSIVDDYFVVLEKLGEGIDNLEVDLIAAPKTATIRSIQRFKREMILLRKSVWPLREVIGGLERGESPLIDSSIYVYLRDIYDHTVQVVDTVETYRDMLSGMLDIYLSSVNNRLNEVMKVLTIIATIFMPLSFIVGLYGMNFQYMPELKWHWGYPAVLLSMAIVAACMIFYFKRKKWF